MADHETKGAAKEAVASVKETVGDALGSEKIKTQAQIDKADAQAERRYGEAASEAEMKSAKPYTQ